MGHEYLKRVRYCWREHSFRGSSVLDVLLFHLHLVQYTRRNGLPFPTHKTHTHLTDTTIQTLFQVIFRPAGPMGRNIKIGQMQGRR